MEIINLLKWGEVIWKYGSYIFIFWAAIKLLNFLLGFLKDKIKHLDTDVDKVAETCNKISLSQEKIVDSQTQQTDLSKKIVFSQGKLVRLINSVDRRINGRK